MNPNFVGCAENSLGIRDWLESQGHEYIVTDDKEGPNCGKHLETETNKRFTICICTDTCIYVLLCASSNKLE